MNPLRLWLDRARDALALLPLALRLLAGRKFWLALVLPLAWPAFQALRLVLGWQERRFLPENVQFQLIGLPLTVLAIGLGVRIVAVEIEQRTLEVTYTVPGGARRVWLAKLAGAVALLIGAEALLAIVTAIAFTSASWVALHGALQGAVFYLVLAMALGTVTRGELTGALATAVALFANLLFTGFGEVQARVSPLFNPLGLRDAPADLLAWTVQNRIGVALATIAVLALTIAAAERRERLLG
jgi:hypothetical protein